MKDKNQIFVVSLAITIIVITWAVTFNANFIVVSDAVYSFLTNNFGWLYLMAITVFVIFSAAIVFSKWGKIKLGPDDSKPEYSTVPWFAMLLGAGMGMGLVFWRISEPLAHFSSPTPGIEAGAEAAANFAIRSNYIHWGLHPRINYCIIGLDLVCFQFRKGKPGLISSIFELLIGGEGINRWTGKTINVLVVFTAVAGAVTSLGLNVMQINVGLNYLFDIPTTLMIQIIIIAVISVVYIWLVVDNISRGVKIISDASLYITINLITVTFLVGPKPEILNDLISRLGQYLQSFFRDGPMTNNCGDNTWVGVQRVPYWVWWTAWAPFVGPSIARIPEDGTIREFTAGVVLTPALGSILWPAIMGNLGPHLGMDGTLSVAQLTDIASKPEIRLFIVIGQYSLGMILCVVSLVLLCTFFITPANSDTFILTMFSPKGDLNPRNGGKVLRDVVRPPLVAGLLVAGGSKPLQTVSPAAIFPLMFITLFTGAALVRALTKEEQLRDKIIR